MEIPVFTTWHSTKRKKKKKTSHSFPAEIVHILLSNVSGRKLFSFWLPTASATSENVSPCWKNNRRQRGKQLFSWDFGLKNAINFKITTVAKCFFQSGPFIFASCCRSYCQSGSRRQEWKDYCWQSPLGKLLTRRKTPLCQREFQR